MSFLKKLSAFIVLLIGCGYLSVLWDGHKNFELTSEKLVRRLGATIVDELAESSQTCRAMARIDTVTVKSDWALASKGLATLYIAGKGDAAFSIDYKIEAVGEKVYVKPLDMTAAQLSLSQFMLSRCS
ncbi:hypothetical protein ACNFBR_26395 [Pseudomonas sp. NY11955]|uniref:hypothetical protein n=1 Tax=Pseudomonas sp. NY11955 TaxID=3400363 RepID=UPI003A89CC65